MSVNKLKIITNALMAIALLVAFGVAFAIGSPAGMAFFSLLLFFLLLKIIATINKKNRKKTRPVPVFFHIGYSVETGTPPKGASLLSNRNSPHNDWREYWPMSQYLQNNILTDNQLIGFFSPKFSEKTNLKYVDLHSFIEQNNHDTDVFLFSPQPEMGAFFPNVFFQGEVFDNGFLAAAINFFAIIDDSVEIEKLWMDSRDIVFSNYVVARPRFWMKWLAIGKKLFEICEGPPSALKDQLTFKTNYPGGVERKVFIMERIASFILASDKSFQVAAYDTFAMSWSTGELSKFPAEAIACDALKIAAKEVGSPHYLHAFESLRMDVFKKIEEKAVLQRRVTAAQG